MAHRDPDKGRGTYHRDAHWADRVEMAQLWRDHLDMLRDESRVFKFKRILTAYLDSDLQFAQLLPNERD